MFVFAFSDHLSRNLLQLLPCQTSVGSYFDSDGYIGQEEILTEFLKLVQDLQHVRG